MAFLKKGDTVAVLSGKEKGKQGKILQVFPKDHKVIVEKIRLIKKHTKPNRDNPQGGIFEKEGLLFVDKVQLVCPKCKKNTRSAYRMLEDKQKVRLCKKCGEIIDKV